MSAEGPIERAGPGLSIWVIYDHPKDSPDLFVAREWIDEAATDSVIVSETLEPLRVKLGQLGRVCIGRQPGDDPVIVECWI